MLGLSESLKTELSEPLGVLLTFGKDSDVDIIKSYIPAKSLLVTVGDSTTEKMINFGFSPDVQIIDGMEKRKNRPPIDDRCVNTNLTCDNPAGTITKSSLSIITQSLHLPKPVRITVNGEEDLLVLPVCCEFPANSIIMYGQPNVGLVIVNVGNSKEKAKNLLNLVLDSML